MTDGNKPEHDTDPTGAPGPDKMGDGDATTERCEGPPVEADGASGDAALNENADTIEDPDAMPLEHQFWLFSVGAAERRRNRKLVRQRESEGRDYVAYEGGGPLAVPARTTWREPAAKVLVGEGSDEERAATTMLRLEAPAPAKAIRNRAIVGAAVGVALVCGFAWALRSGGSPSKGDVRNAGSAMASTAAPSAPSVPSIGASTMTVAEAEPSTRASEGPTVARNPEAGSAPVARERGAPRPGGAVHAPPGGSTKSRAGGGVEQGLLEHY